ncbi:MAG TPA: hypothetical protein GXZ45_09565 [Propionibacterium sp.]|nr:hypothetical protein [Propionibacterium sp.]
MRLDPRPAVVLAALAGLGVGALADWWRVAWAGGMAAEGTAGLSGSTGTGGLAAILPSAVLAAMLATLTLGTNGRRAVGLVAAALGIGMAAVGLAGPTPSDAVVEQQLVAATLGGEWSLTATAAPVAYGVIGLIVAAASAWLAARPPVRRVRGVREASGEVTDPLASWKAMDDGQDPTDDEGERA